MAGGAAAVVAAAAAIAMPVVEEAAEAGVVVAAEGAIATAIREAKRWEVPSCFSLAWLSLVLLCLHMCF